MRLGILLLCGLIAGEAAAQARTDTVALTLDSGRIVEARVRVPAACALSCPAVMLFGGFRGAARVLDAVPAEAPLIAASFDYPFDPPRKFRFPQSFGDLPAVKDGIDDSFEGIERLTAHLRTRPEVDASRVTIIGASLGTPFAVTAAADHGIPGLVLIHGFGELRRVIAHQFIRKLEPRVGAWIRGPAWGLSNALVWGMRLPAPERDARKLQAGQRVLMVAAREDEQIPPLASEALWRGLQASSARIERIDHDGAHLRGIDDLRVVEMVGIALDWMRREDLY